jgi:uncharacterized SAM-binding protein YcdF (DUF218 family)
LPTYRPEHVSGLEERNIPVSAIRLASGSINAHKNAIRSYQIFVAKGIKRILLVASALHMPRAAGTFRKAGFEVIAVPADFRTGWGDSSLLEKLLPSANDLLPIAPCTSGWGITIYRLWGWM